ncbi:HEPN family nuclease [Runella limosa]|uniref:HEPN family nuclease n=1 Tax=Runella limosa TaxID=370978 RepID=UPI000409F85D|nr:HEPN family nuclease [Runella limosa]
MGNYYQLEIDFVRRTLNLIDQYEELKEQYPFDQQYNHTLLTNCLLGLIVLPKEKALTYIPKTRLAFVKALKEWGITKSTFNPEIKDTSELFQRLRNAVAHFDIDFISETPEHLIDRIEFRDVEAGIDVATFYADEFLQFLRYYSTSLLANLERH